MTTTRVGICTYCGRGGARIVKWDAANVEHCFHGECFQKLQLFLRREVIGKEGRSTTK